MTEPAKPRLRRGIYAITDCARMDFEHLQEITSEILAGGAVALQYRDKAAPRRLLRTRARSLQQLCNVHGVPFIINDDVELAREVSADGVHLGRDDPECARARAVLGGEALIGVSCYNDFQRALDARDNGADYVAFGAFFPTSTKTGTASAGPDLLRQARQTLSIPIVAIGGISPDNGATLIQAGADCLAVISSIYQAPDPLAVMRAYSELFTG